MRASKFIFISFTFETGHCTNVEKKDPHHLIVRLTRKICRNLSHFVITTPLILIWVCTFSFQQNVNTRLLTIACFSFRFLIFHTKQKNFIPFLAKNKKKPTKRLWLTDLEGKIFLYYLLNSKNNNKSLCYIIICIYLK